MNKEIEIPDGYEARIEGNKVIIKQKESEDERIRKRIILRLRHDLEQNPNKFTKKEIPEEIAYLEKQKEQNIYKSSKSEIDFADRYSKDVWEKLMSKFKAVEGYRIGCNDVSDIVLNAILNAFKWQKEQSITANDLDEEVHRFFDDCIVVHEAKLYGNISERVIPVDCYELTARHFAKWGEKQKEQKQAEKNAYPPTLDEAIKLYYNTYGNGKGGFDYLSLPKFQDIVETFVNNYGKQSAEWSEEEQQTISFAVDWLTKMLERTNVPEAKRDIESVILGLKSLRPQPH